MTDERLVLAIDCSTTGAKAVLFDAGGAAVASASAPLAMQRPRPGWHEQDAPDWWTATRAAIRGLEPALRARAAAICITHQRESFACLDRSGDPVRPAVLWLDSRAVAEIAELGSPRVHALSGKPPDVTPALYKLAWLDRHEPQALHRATTVTEVHGYLVHRLTGDWVTSTGSADSLGLLDLRAGDWSAELLALGGVRPDQVPRLVPPGEVIGHVIPSVATDLGLPSELAVVAGIGDGQAAGLGVGVNLGDRSGAAYLNLGTSMVLGVPTAGYLTGREFRTMAGFPSGSYVLETILNAAAYLADWFRRELGDPARGVRPDPELEAAAAALPPGADGLLTLPYWNCAQTPYWDGDARGAMVGWHGGHTRAHAYRSLLEGVAFELRLHLEGLETASGTTVSVLRTIGGGSRSPAWTQIIADVTRRPVQLPAGSAAGLAGSTTGLDRTDASEAQPDGDAQISARGAAVLGWAALGVTMGPLPGGFRQVEPRPDAAQRYDALYAVQRLLYPSLREVFAGLAALG